MAMGMRFAMRAVVMGSIARRVIGDVAASASGVLILLLALAVFDQRFREQLAAVTGGGPGAAEVASMGNQVTNLALVVSLVVVQFFRQQSVEHAHLMVFTAAAIVLALFLMRL